MRKNKYQIEVSLNENLFLHYNSFSDKYILMNKDSHDLYEQSTPEDLEKKNKSLFDKLVAAKYFVDDGMNEQDIIIFNRLSQKTDSTLYHVVVNTTLDCNLRCWYCYENRLKDSKLTEDTISLVKKNIVAHFETHPYTSLKLSFFGGEPFMNFPAIADLLSFARTFCEGKRIRLMADFTTNSTLMTDEMIFFLKDYDCYFQITLDGNRAQHNRIKRIKDVDSYQLAINNIHALSTIIPKSHLWVRINYDETTLSCIDEILDDLDTLDRSKVFLTMRKVWQVKPETIKTSLLLQSIQKVLDKGFIVDSYFLSTHKLCFAERINQALFNYDGKVFKCSTVPKFDDEHSMGTLNSETGEVVWDENKISQVTKIMYPQKCQDCGLFGACYGACNNTLMQYPTRDFCILQELNMDMREYLMYNFKVSLQANRAIGMNDTYVK